MPLNRIKAGPVPNPRQPRVAPADGVFSSSPAAVPEWDFGNVRFGANSIPKHGGEIEAQASTSPLRPPRFRGEGGHDREDRGG